ncbi:hypothetical protein HYFRA_00010057 [Hymenoscyphus fraxineus]|uniref:Cytochrome P450 n=1 Tax=Hymenoscyphus fraxineus TaxID=746836 RepID=A0A9N9KVE8_9HELO|nr:hypothetical protein HYFRA_00010057 [Hymenoscyphus fraxineus]
MADIGDFHSDSDINYQLSEHILPNAVNTITRWHSFWDIRVLMNPLRPIIQRYYGKVLQRYIRKELNARTKGPSSAISLAIDAFFQEKKNEEVSETMELDEDFAAIVSHQIRLFLFAGTDTTSSTLAFVYHLISKHPEVVSRLREEHNQVFGPDPSSVSGLLKAKPTLLNQCPYTLAVIKETLRIYPPATNLRQGTTGVSLPALNGQLLPTEGLFIIINHQAIHQNPRIWKQANEFLPERWLVPSDHDLYPPAGAYRPFDIGSRACIGQTLSLIEMRIALVMTCRTFDLRPAYGEWDRIRARDAGWWRRIGGMMGFGRGEMKEVRGDRAYQTEKAGTHPSDGYPCRVSVLGGGGL